MPCLQFKPALDNIKAKHLENKELQRLQVPKELKGKINIILGIRFNRIYPEIICTLPCGLQVLKLKFLPAVKGEMFGIGESLGAVSSMVNNIGAQSVMPFMSHLISVYKS